MFHLDMMKLELLASSTNLLGSPSKGLMVKEASMEVSVKPLFSKESSGWQPTKRARAKPQDSIDLNSILSVLKLMMVCFIGFINSGGFDRSGYSPFPEGEWAIFHFCPQ